MKTVEGESTGKIRLTGAQALVRVLTASGIGEVFGVCGGNLNGILAAIAASNDSLRYIGCRHEASGAFMAAAVFNAAQRPAACLAELGPGTVNLVGGLGMAFNNNLALLAITSSWPKRKVSPLVGTMMELDAIALTRPVTKWNAQVPTVERIPNVVRWALREALGGRPGPVHLDFPNEVLQAEAEFDVHEVTAPLEHFSASGRSHADPQMVRVAAEKVANAKRPLLLAGGGVIHSGAVEEFRTLAGVLRAPATCTQMAIGVVPTSDPTFIGHGGALGGRPVKRALEQADVIVAVGCRISSWLKDGTQPIAPGWPRQEFIHIDIDPSSFGRVMPVSVGLAGDAKAVLSQIIGELRNRVIRSEPGWLSSLVSDQSERMNELLLLAGDNGSPLHPAAVAREFGEFVPRDSLVVYDGGYTTFWTNDLTPALEGGTRFNDSGMAQLGFGTPYALGLKAIYPTRPVFNVIGDGSFGFTLSELDTARRYGLNCINVIHNNESWGVIRAGQQRDNFEFGVDLAGCDYASIARAFGCYGETVTERSEIKPALQRAIDSNLPAVLDIRTRFERHPSYAEFGATLR